MSVNQYKNGKLNLVAGASNAPDVLDSYEEIQANTASGKVAGALGVKELLGGLRFGTDGEGNYGYFGADGSLIPFSNSYQLFCVITTSTDQYQASVCCIDIKDGVITKSTAVHHKGGSHSSDMGTVSYSGSWKLTLNQDFIMNGTEYSAGQNLSWWYTESVAYCFIKK